MARSAVRFDAKRERIKCIILHSTLKKSIFIFRDWISFLSLSQVIFFLLGLMLVISHHASSKCEW